MIIGNIIYCDCCNSEKLAEIVGENLVIKDRRHGIKHVAVIPIASLLDKIENGKYATEKAGSSGK